jgi:hypothetical protein
MKWKVGDSNRGAGEIVRTPPERPEASPSELFRGYRVSFPRVKSSVREVNYTTLITTEIKERIRLYIYSQTETSLPLVGKILRFLVYIYIYLYIYIY